MFIILIHIAAKKAFQELGDLLQRTRRNDYWDTFSLYLENGEDPALKDADLLRKLIDNRTEGEKRLAAVFEKYTKKQEEMKEQNDIETTSEEGEDEECESLVDDKKKDDISVTSLSGEDSDNEENINEKINKDNRLLVKNGMCNINTINIYRKTDKVTSNKTLLDTSQEYNEKNKIKTPVKENNIVIPKNKDQTINEKKIVYKVCNNNTVAKNVNIDAETPKDSLPTCSTADCTSDINKIEGL